MNPYEEPQAELESPIRRVGPRHMDWMALFASALICFIASAITLAILVQFFSATYRPPQWVVNLCLLAPWAIGAAFLGWKVQSRWYAHALIYSVIPPLILIAWVFSQLRSMLQLSVVALIALLASIFVTLITMSIMRLLTSVISLQK